MRFYMLAMSRAMYRRSPIASAALVASLFSTACGIVATGFVGLSLPLEYDGDSLLVWIIIKTLATHAWVFGNDALGFPTYMELGHFPMSFVGQLAALKALLGTGLDPITAINVYYVLTFGLTAGVAVWAMCSLGVEPAWAAAGASAYSLLPYHFLRMPGHLFLAGYYMVPIGALVLMQLDAQAPAGASVGRRQMALCAAMTLFNDIYYTFFLGYLIGAAAVFRLLATRDWRRVVPFLQALGAISCSCSLSMMPALWALWRPGAEASPLIRPMSDSETYGLKLIQMLLPVPGHRNVWLAYLTDVYTATAPLVTENQTASLGLVGALCFIAVCVVGLARLFADTPLPKHSPSHRLVGRLALFILLAFIFGTIGGLGAILSYTTTSFIRCTNRIVIFIAFFAITGGMLLLQQLLCAQRTKATLRWLVVAGIFAIVYTDVTDVHYFPNRFKAAQAYQTDHAFFEGLERSLPQGARIFELPYVTVIEGGFGRLDYLQALPFLHTHHLKFSFGAFRNTSGDRRNFATSTYFELDQPLQTLQRLREEGFDAVLLNRALPNRGDPDMPRHISQALGPPRLSNPSRQFVLFDVAPLRKRPSFASERGATQKQLGHAPVF